MKRLIVTLCFILLCAVLPLMANYNPKVYNVVWDSPSLNASGTMPIGNGDIGANVYALDSGDLYLLLSKNDAFNYCGDLLKTGRVKINLSPNPFERGEKFRQTLDLATGSILIETKNTNIRIWSDMNNPICHVDIDSKQDIKVTATPDPWERYDHGLYNTLVKKNPNPVAQDVVKRDGDQLVWYYHVGDFSVLADDYAYYGVEHLLSSVDDPYKYNTFGNLVSCDKLQADGESISGKGRKFEIMIHSLLQRTPDPKSWVAAIKKQADEYHHSDLYWESHKDWWSNFWDRSWIRASNNTIPSTQRELLYGEADSNGIRNESDDAALVSQSYNVFRFLMACQSRGAIQTKFNGGIFTQQLAMFPNANYSKKYKARKRTGGLIEADTILLTHEDDRLWGRRFTWQNQRLLYWPLLASGDYDLLQPFYNYYDNMLEVRREITKGWFGHEGLYFRENICPTGGERDTQPTSGRLPDASRPSKRGAGATSEWLHEFYFYSSLELVIMMVEYSEYTTDEYFTQRYLLPMAREVLKFYDRHYDRDDNGKLRLDPAAVLETFSRAVNPATDISALRRVLGDLISHNIGSDKDMAYWKRLLSEVPEIPMQKTPEGKVAIAPAEIHGKKINTENGELYPVFPAMLYGVAQGTQDIVENTMGVRVEKDARGGVCWTQDQIDWAFAGKAEEVRFGLERRFRVASTQCRFPLFGKEEPDSCPDFDHFGSGSIALQKMLIQEDGEKIFLFPAWSAKWDVDFKLHAHNNTVVEGVVKDGKVVEWSITPKYRAKDVTICEIQK